MRFPGLGGYLRQKECCHIERMICKFDNSHSTFGVSACSLKGSTVQRITESRVETEIAEELFLNLLFPVGSASQGIRDQADTLGFTDQGTGESGNEQGLGPGCRFFVVCILNSQDISGILYQSMLEAPSGPNKRDSLLASIPDTIERSLHTRIRA